MLALILSIEQNISSKAKLFIEKGAQTVGSDPTSCVTPAVSPTALFNTFRKTQDEIAGSLYWQVRQANCSWRVSLSSFGYNIFELYIG